MSSLHIYGIPIGRQVFPSVISLDAGSAPQLDPCKRYSLEEAIKLITVDHLVFFQRK